MENFMPKTLEELKKILNEHQIALLIKASQEQLNRMEQEAYNKLHERLIDEEGLDVLPSTEQLIQLQKGYSQTITAYEVEFTSDKVKAKIFENFAQEFGKENIKNDTLYFPDNIKANDFFQCQAKAGQAFLFKQCGCDNFAYSDGKGHYQMGSKAEIISYCKQNSLNPPTGFQEELSAEPTTPSLAASMR